MSIKIQFQDVKKTYGVQRPGSKIESRTLALDAVNLDIEEGEFLVIVGPSGCGKSTLLDLLSGLAKPSSGRILLDGKAVVGPALDRGVVFQQYALFPWRTALGNVEFGLEAKGVPAPERRRTAREFLDLVGLAEFEDRYPHELSGGMKQRVAIARSLAYEPDVLMLDEPFAALDAQTRETLQTELLRIWQRSKKTILFVTHGIDEAVYLGQRVAILSSRPGRVKKVVEVPPALRALGEAMRGDPEFARIRHEIWTSLREEMSTAEAQERRFRLDRSSEVSAHV